MFIPSTQNAADIAALYGALTSTAVGEVCPFATLSAALGRDVRDARHLLQAAITRANKEDGALFASVHRVGYKRLAPDEAHLVGSHTRGRLRRSTRRASSTIARALERANDMDHATRRKAMAEITTLNLLNHMATDKATAGQQDDAPRPTGVALQSLLDNLRGRAA